MELPCQWFLFFLCWENFYHKTSLSVIFSFVGKISIIKISPLCYLFFLIIFQGFKTEKCLTSPFTLEIFIKSMWAKMFLVKESSSLQLLSRVQPFSTPWTAARHASLSISNSWSLPKLMPIELVMPSSWSAIQLSHPLLSPSPPAFNLPQHQGLFQQVSSSHTMAKVLEFQVQHQSFQWMFRTDFL